MPPTDPTVTDWMSAWGQIIGALGGSAGFAALFIEIRRRSRANSRPPAGLLDLLIQRHEAFSDIIAQGGQESQFFLSPELRSQYSMLALISGQIVDDELNTLVGMARAEWEDAFALAPGHGALSDPGNAGRLAQQVEAASRGRVATARAINRANEIVRTRPPA